MPSSGTDREIRLSRMTSHGLLPHRPAPRDVAGVVHRMVALQAQHDPAVGLAVRARAPRLAPTAAQAALAEGDIVRTWALRGSLHVLAAEDVAWLVGLLGGVHLLKGRRRLAQLGVDAEGEERAAEVLIKALASGPLSRLELGEHLERAGFDLTSNRQTLFHLIQRAGLRGVLCYTGEPPERFVLMTDVVRTSDGPRGADGVRELIRRYLAGHAPATPRDFVAWSGLPAADVRAAWPAVAPKVSRGDISGPAVTLLGPFDAYLLGYADRSAVLNPSHAKQVQRGGGWLHPLVLVDGEVRGTWRAEGPIPSVTVTLFDDLDVAAAAALRDEVGHLERFLGATSKADDSEPLSG